MADVRLTATNPEDSSVVPVACDAAGRLLLEEPQVIEGPPGPPGEQGPPGQDGQDGDPFSGNFAGDVTFGGSAEFAGDKINLYANGGIRSQRGDGSDISINGGSTAAFQVSHNESPTTVIGHNGSATFANTVQVGTTSNRLTNGVWGYQSFGTNNENGLAVYYASGHTTTAAPYAFRCYLTGTGDTVAIRSDGSCTFAGNKAGFTAEGYLWCTTRRGDTVILDATSNGLASWVEYTPSTRAEEIRDKLNANRGDTGEMPADTQ